MTLGLNIFSTLSTRVAMLMLALASSVVLARGLGPEGRGLFALVLLLPDLARTFGLLGFDQANIVYAGLSPAGRRALVWQSLFLALVLGTLAALVCGVYLLAGAPGIPGLVRGPFWLYWLPLATLPASLLVAFWGELIRGMNLILLANLLELSGKFAAVGLLALTTLGLGLGVQGAVLVDAALPALTAVVLLFCLHRLSLWGPPRLDPALWRNSLRLAAPSYAASMLGYLNYRADHFVVAALLSPEQLGLYVIAVTLAERLWILVGAVANALLPHLTNSPTRDPSLSARIARNTLVWTGSVGALAYLLAHPVVELLFSSAFSGAVSPLRWLLPGIVALTPAKVVVAELLARQRVRFLVWVSGAGLLANLAGNLLLIPLMGIAGAALASTISYSAISFAVIAYYLRVTGLPWRVLQPRFSDLSSYSVLWRRRAPPISPYKPIRL